MKAINPGNMKIHFYPNCKILLCILAIVMMSATYVKVQAQATYAVPVSIGNNSCTSGKGFVQFRYTSNDLTLAQLPPTNCNLSNLASPGFYEYNAGISFNPKDTNLYYTRYSSPNTYVWRWKPGSACPPSTALLTVYNNTYVIGLTFDADGTGYQLIYTGSSGGSGYGLSMQSVDFVNNVFGPVIPVTLPSGMNPLQGNGDFVITPTGQFLAILDNNYITINYKDYNNTPLHATLISKLTGDVIIGLSYSDGKLVASDYYISSGKYRSRYYEIGIIDGAKTNITTAPCYFSTDMTDINTAIGVAKNLVSAIPTGTPGTYDLCYDITVRNYGNWPLDHVRLEENLGAVFNPPTLPPFPPPPSAISNVSVSFIDNPAGVVLNPAFNGVSNREILDPNQSLLPASPTSKNYFIVRVCLRVKNIQVGKVYNNNAFAYGNGYIGALVKDKSTNGTNPDLNNNAKPDDVGEDQPTPFVILTTAEMPPCEALNKIMYKQEFGSGSGSGLQTAIPAPVIPGAAAVSTDYVGSTSQPLNVEQYAIARNANHGNTTRWISRTDHTGNSNGRMMVVNADVKSNKIYSDKINISCGNLKYSLFAFVSNIANSTYDNFCDAFGGTVKPKLTFTVKDAASGLIITNLTTPEITSGDWTQYGMKFVMPATVNGNPVTQIIIEISNAAAGGCGNDLAIDDIQFGLCDPTPTVSVNNTAGCTNGITTFSAALSDPTVISGPLEYQWQRSNNGTSGWADITGANSEDYTISPLQPSDIGKYYRVIVAAAGNISNANCRYTSTAFQLTAKTSSTAPTGIDASPAQTTCPGNAVNLTVQGGSLGTNAVWRWYRNSCGDTLIGTGNMISVLPTETTTYYVRAEGDCNITACAQVTINLIPCVILPVDFLQFSAVQRAHAIDLDWRIITSEQISHFEVERSGNGNHFNKIGTVTSAVPQNTAARFTYQDADPDVNSNIIYYRIKVVSKDGVSKYSNILTVRISAQNNGKLKISPNPASSSVNISFYSALRGTMELQILDMTGKIVLREQRTVESGQNSITLNQLSRLSEGVYTIFIRTGDRMERERIVIRR
jgi:hypothetical protein